MHACIQITKPASIIDLESVASYQVIKSESLDIHFKTYTTKFTTDTTQLTF